MQGVVPGQDDAWAQSLAVTPRTRELTIAMDFNPTRFSAILSLIIVQTHARMEDHEEIHIKTRMTGRKPA